MNTRLSMDISRDWEFSPWPEPDDDEEDSWEDEGMSISIGPHQPVLEV